jgi:FecR-like protein
MWKSQLQLVLVAVGMLVPAAFAQQDPGRAPAPGARTAGKVVLVEGDTRFRDRAGAERRPKLGDPLYEGDRLLTGADGEVHVAMADGGYIGVRPGTEMSVDLFVADGGRDDRSEISLVKGSFRTITGWIGKAQNALIRTFDATIGIRGTDHEPLVVPPGAAEGEPGTYDRVYFGATVIETPGRSVDLKAGQAGYAPRGAGIPPRVLAIIPSFYRPARNEARFVGLHDRIQEQLEKLRQERGLSGDARAGRDDRTGGDDRSAGRPDRAERADRPDKPDTPARPQRPDRIDRPARPAK